MMRLYRNWPVALADRAGLLPAGRLTTFHVRASGTIVQLTGETAVEDVRVLNEMWLEDPYLRGFEGLPADTTCVVDIGANRGNFASRIACGYPSAHIFSYEPEPLNAAILRLNVARNHLGGRIQVVEAAVTATVVPTVQLALAPLPGRHTMLAIERHMSNAQFITVAAIQIGEALHGILQDERSIDLLKLDVEGLEPALLKAIPEDTYPYLNRIAAEIDDPSKSDNLSIFLSARGFSVSVSQGHLYAVRVQPGRIKQ
jgi:FkbM family methyltransferase